MLTTVSVAPAAGAGIDRPVAIVRFQVAIWLSVGLLHEKVSVVHSWSAAATPPRAAVPTRPQAVIRRAPPRVFVILLVRSTAGLSL